MFNPNNFVAVHGIKQPPLAFLQRVRKRLYFLIPPLLLVITVVLVAVASFGAFKISTRFVKAMLAGVVFFLLTLWGEEFVLLAPIAISTTLLDVQSLPYLFGFSSDELVVFFLLGLVLVNYLSGKNSFVHTPLDWPVFLFVIATIISLLNAKYNLGTVSNFRNFVSRMMVMYLVFFVVTNLIRTRRQLMRLLGGMLILASITAVLVVVQQALGGKTMILPFQEHVNNATVLGQELVGVGRISSPGSALVYVLLFPVFILYTTPEYMGSRKWLLFIPVVFFPMAIAFTFTRGLWIGTAFSAIVFIFLGRDRRKSFVLLVLALVIMSYLLVPLLGAYFPRVNTIVAGLAARFGSLFADDELVYDSSTQWRLKENELALAKVKEYPILGIGPGADYRAEWYEGDDLMHYVHNGYLWLLVDFGLVAAIMFLWFSIVYLVRAFLFGSCLHDRILGGLVIGLALSYLALLVCNISSPRLFSAKYILLVSFILGISEVAIKLDRERAS